MMMKTDKKDDATKRQPLMRMTVCSFVILLLWTGSAAAHRVNVFAWVEGDTVYTESKFSGGKRVKGGEVLVYDAKGNLLLSGKTDTEGGFSFNIPQKTAMRIVLKAGTGHRGEWTIPRSEVDPEASGSPSAPAHGKPSDTPKTESPRPSADPDQIRHTLEQTLDRRLNPILKMIAASQDKGPTLRDILGGIGYILGLMGLAAYIHFRRKARELEEQAKGR